MSTTKTPLQSVEVQGPTSGVLHGGWSHAIVPWAAEAAEAGGVQVFSWFCLRFLYVFLRVFMGFLRFSFCFFSKDFPGFAFYGVLSLGPYWP